VPAGSDEDDELDLLQKEEEIPKKKAPAKQRAPEKKAKAETKAKPASIQEASSSFSPSYICKNLQHGLFAGSCGHEC
jgi:hypothetical protein